MEKVFFIILMAIFTKVNGSMTRQMVRVLTLTRMEPNMLENGKMTSRMEWGLKSGLMDSVMRDSIKTVQKLEKGY